jgi:hypothetical protein
MKLMKLMKTNFLFVLFIISLHSFSAVAQIENTATANVCGTIGNKTIKLTFTEVEGRCNIQKIDETLPLWEQILTYISVTAILNHNIKVFDNENLEEIKHAFNFTSYETYYNSSEAFDSVPAAINAKKAGTNNEHFLLLRNNKYYILNSLIFIR